MNEPRTNISLIRKGRLVRFGRSRFSWFILSLVIFVSVGLGTSQLRLSHAGTTSLVSGRVTDAKTGYGIPNVTLDLCHSISVVTNASGDWSIVLPSQTSLCVMYKSGAPSTFIASSAINLPASASVRNLYEYQITDYNCYHVTTNPPCYLNAQSYDRSVDSGYDLAFTLAVPYIPPPTPAPTPAPTPTPMPQVTPTPVPGSTSGSGSSQSGGTGAGATQPTATPHTATGSAASTDTEAPTAPANMKAISAQTNALVNLSWDASHDNVGVAAYELDRSVDGITWLTLDHSLKATGYQDTTVAYELTYRYRVRALDGKGNASAYTTATAHTATFVTNTSQDVALSYTSDDGAAMLYALPGTFAKNAQCSVLLGGWSKLKLDTGSAILAGPYQLLCKDADGNVISGFSHPVRWTITPRKSNLKLASPKVYEVQTSGKPSLAQSATYAAKSGTFTYTQTTNKRVIVLANQQTPPIVVAAIVFAVLLIMGIAGFTFISFQRKRIAGYKSYLRDKYYNL